MSTFSISNDPGEDKDQSRTNSKEGASYATLLPYTPLSAKKNKKGQYRINFEDLFGPENWTKFYEIASPEKDDFNLYSTLATEVGYDVLFRHQKEGPCIIEAANQEQSEKLQKLVEIRDPKLPIKKNETLNTCHGTIIVPNNVETGDKDFSECGEKIKENIKMQGLKIKNVIPYVKPVRGRRKFPLRIAKITFEGRMLPDTVIVAGQRLSVREYLPTPRQCNKCWKFGHGTSYCKADTYTCPICSLKGHQKDGCKENTSKTCINCQGNHPAFSKTCLHYRKQQLIVKTQFKEGLSYTAAVNRLKQTGEISSFNYKAALENKKPPVTSTPKVAKPSTTNRFSALQIEDSKSHVTQKCNPQISPKKISKRNRDSSSEEELSPKLKPKQKAKNRNENNEVHTHTVVAEIHINENSSMDDTIIYTQDHENLNVEPGKNSSPLSVTSELTSPTVLASASIPAILPPKPSPLAVMQQQSPALTVVPQESLVSTVKTSESVISTVEPSASTILTAMPSASNISNAVSSESSTSTAMPSDASTTTMMSSEPLLPTVMSPESSIRTVVSSEAAIAITAPADTMLAGHRENSLPTETSENGLNKAKTENQEKMPEENLRERKKSQAASVTNKNASKNVKLSILKGQSKNTKKVGTSEPTKNRIKNLVHDYHMPPGFKGGK